MLKDLNKKSLFLIITTVLVLFLYYQLDYKRHYISNSDGTKTITVWTRLNNKCYILPYKYYSPFSPNTNYIKTKAHKNYIGIIFNTTNEDDSFDISLYNEFEKNNFNSKIDVFSKNKNLLSKYKINSLNKDKILMKELDYKYIDLNRVYGIKVFDYNDFGKTIDNNTD